MNTALTSIRQTYDTGADIQMKEFREQMIQFVLNDLFQSEKYHRRNLIKATFALLPD